jgi:hypothetical protein
MTPREKADELYSKYDDLLNKDFGNPIVFDNQLKQCTLIAVDELIEQESSYNNGRILSIKILARSKNRNRKTMTPKERANILYNKYSKEYNRFVVSGYIKQGYDEWKEIAIELGKLYKQ